MRILLMVFNFIGMAVYLILASRGWRATDGGETAAEPFIWMLCLPVLALFAILDVGWGVQIMIKRASGQLPLAIVTALWMVVVMVDFAHH